MSFIKFLADYGRLNYSNEFAMIGDYKEQIYRDVWNAAISAAEAECATWRDAASIRKLKA